MGLKKFAVQNKGMSQDVSVSKETQEYAFENYNIRIQATDDNTLLSVTNIKGPSLIPIDLGRGKLIGSCEAGDYLILFIKGVDYEWHPTGFTPQSETSTDRILRIDKDFNIAILAENDSLNFHEDKKINTLYYYESQKVQKVYWVDGWYSDDEIAADPTLSNNYPRVINILNVPRPADLPTMDTNALSIFPVVGSLPEVTVTKMYSIPSQLPAGVIQYFISYYNYNGAETLLSQATPLYYIDYETKGAAPDATGVCALELTINNLDTSYEYVRIYSAIRTSVNTSPIVSIVKDIKIPASGPVTLIDNGINQENVSSELLYYIGGSPLYATTIAQKDNTAFYGNIKDSSIYFTQNELNALSDALYYDINDPNSGGIYKSKILSINKKTVQIGPSSFGTYYTYRKQDEDSRTFKAGEIYRFAIQFQNTVGVWSDPIWCGDLEMPAQSFLTENNPNVRNAYINNVVTLLNEEDTPQDLDDILAGTSALTILNSKDVCNYRILMADAESSNGRKIAAQGLVSPTMFNIKQRYNNAPYALASWITRPVNVEKAPTHHLEPLNDPACINAELNSTFNPGGYYTVPFRVVPSNYDINKSDYYILETAITPHNSIITVEFILAVANASNLGNGGYSNADNILVIDYHTGDYNTAQKAADALNNFVHKNRVTSINNSSTIFADTSGTVFAALRDAIYTYYNETWHALDTAINRPDIGISDPALVKVYNEGWIPTIAGNSSGYPDGVYNAMFNTTEDTPIDPNSNYPYCINTNLKYSDAISQPSVGTTRCYVKVIKVQPPATDDYYIDTSIVTLNSPEIDNNSTAFDNKKYQFRIVGNSAIASTYSDISLSASGGLYQYSGILKDVLVAYRHTDPTSLISINTPYFNSDYVYTDYGWEHPAGLNPANGLAFPGKKQAYYKIFMWHKQGSILGVDKRTSWYPPYWNDNDQIITDPYPAELEDKTIFNQKMTGSCFYSYGANVDYGEVSCKSLNESDAAGIDIQSEYKLYYGNYDNLIASDNMLVLRKWNVDDVLDIDDDTIAIPGLCRIQFKSSPHVVFNLGTTNIGGTTYINILPFSTSDNVWDVNVGKDEIDDVWSSSTKLLEPLSALHLGTDYNFISCWDRSLIVNGKYISPTTLLSGDAEVLIGELYSNIAYNELYGGYSDESLKKLTWIPISNVKDIENSVTKTYGDTYYQMYDCLKTYPVLDTENFENKVVDITSVMVETHYNIDGRYDNNRASFNIMTRPSNFNLYNLVYSQKNNLFSYNMYDTKLSSNEYPQQINWTFVKNYIGDVDTWCSPLMMNLTNVKHELTQLVNFNNSLIALTEHSIEKVNYNEKTFMQTDSEYVEVANSGKIDGTTELQYPYGTYNQTYLITEKGLYFIDDNEKSIIRINLDGGVTKIALSKMDSWMKNTIVQGTYIKESSEEPFHLEYDLIHKDVYIINSVYCLIYNEILESFTSFTDFQDTYTLFSWDGNLFSVANISNYKQVYDTGGIIPHQAGYSIGTEVKLYTMYSGKYNTTYGNTANKNFVEVPRYINYYMQFRLNPAPYSDKTFTNIEFNADLGTDEWLNQNTHRDDTSIIDANSSPTREYPVEPVVPFTTIRAWNEYQDTLDKTLQYNKGYNTYGMGNVSAKFRTWRAEIPREWCKRDVTKTIDGVQQTVTEVNPHNYYGRNRIRNPWIHLKLSNNNPKDTKMEFHNMLVQYLE